MTIEEARQFAISELMRATCLEGGTLEYDLADDESTTDAIIKDADKIANFIMGTTANKIV